MQDHSAYELPNEFLLFEVVVWHSRQSFKYLCIEKLMNNSSVFQAFVCLLESLNNDHSHARGHSCYKNQVKQTDR